MLFTALAIGLGLAPSSRGAIYTNTISAFAFEPATRTLSVGDTVVWVNLDGVGHTVTGDAAAEPVCGPGFLLQGSRCERTFDTVGTFTYHCDPHESMTGTIVVLPPGNNAPDIFIIFPTEGASFLGPTQVLIRAVAIDPDGTVQNVTFFDGATPLGSDTHAPFEIVAQLGIGPHVLAAVATDDGGAQATSFPVRISVHPPLRLLTLSPGSNLVLRSTATNYLNVFVEYKTNVSAVTWMPLPVRSNRLTNGLLETICGRPPGNSVFIRLGAR